MPDDALKNDRFEILRAAVPVAVFATIVCCALWALFFGIDGGTLDEPLRTAGGTLFLCFTAWLFLPAASARVVEQVRASRILWRLRDSWRISAPLILFAALMGWPGHIAFFGKQDGMWHGWILSLILAWAYWVPLALTAILYERQHSTSGK